MSFKYRKDIRDTIIRIEADQINANLNYSKLYKNVVLKMGCTLSHTDFNDALKRLIEDKLLNKIEDRSSKLKVKPVLYPLTERAKKIIKLNLVAHPKADLFRRIYEKLLLYEALYSLHKVIQSEQELGKFLSSLNLNRENLVWGRLAVGEESDNSDMVYGSNNVSFRKSFVKKYWEDRPNQSKVIADIEFICWPFVGRHDLHIKKIERWEINKDSKHKKCDTKYTYEGLGVSIEEFMNNNLLGSKFERIDIEEVFKLAKENHLIEPALVCQGQVRFRISDQRLRTLMEDIKEIYQAEFEFLSYKWSHYDGPTQEEKSRMSRFLGEQEASRLFRNMEVARHRIKKVRERCKNVEEYNERLRKYDCIQMCDDFMFDFRLEDYKSKRDKIPVTENEHRNDIMKFDQYIKQKLLVNLEDIPANLEDEGVECVKMIHGKTIKDYAFLHDVLKDVCPKIFEPENEQLRENLINEVGIEKGGQIHAKKLKAAKLRNESLRKNKRKKIPYRYVTAYNPFTRKTERQKVLKF